MISEVELRSLARRWNVNLMLVDLDYSLGCFLAGLSQQNLAGHWRFKGGTCLRKCYFPDYRFSEDLDFTAESRLTEAKLKAIVAKAVRWVEREIGLDFSAAPVRVETITDGKRSAPVRSRRLSRPQVVSKPSDRTSGRQNLVSIRPLRGYSTGVLPIT